MQRVPWWKPFILVALIVLFLAFPIRKTYQWYSLPQIDRQTLTNEEVRQSQEEYESLRTSLVEKLDHLKSGETLDPEEEKALEQEIAGIREKMDVLSKEITTERERLDNLRYDALPIGLDLQGGIHAVLQVDTSRGKGDREKQEIVESVLTKINNRLDQRQVREYVAQRRGENFILVQVPGIGDPALFRDLIGRTGELSFKLLYQPEETASEMVLQILRNYDEQNGTRLVSGEYVQLGVGVPEPVVSEELAPAVRRELFTVESGREVMSEGLKNAMESVRPGFSKKHEMAFGAVETDEKILGGRPHRRLYLLQSKVQVSGQTIASAFPDQDPGRLDFYISMSFTPEGRRAFKQVTGDNVGKRLAVVLDNTVFSAPVIQDEIAGGRAQITGNFTIQEANDLSIILREGALDAPTTIEELRAVDPLLGAHSIYKGLRAGLIGAFAVVVFMLLYYRFCGIVANLALILNIFFLIGCMALFKATLTLPGIAGIVLFIGMAVDANVLIFERIREEMKSKPGRAMGLHVDRGYGQAFHTIVDANVTTLIAALVLFQFGTGPVQGFAVTLSLGIIISLLTAIVVTRIFMDFWTSNLGVRHISLGGFSFLQDRKIRFLKYGKLTATLSSIVLVLGLVVLFTYSEQIFGIDFSGGSLVRVAFVQDVEGKLTSEQLQQSVSSLEKIESAPRVQKEEAIGQADDGGASSGEQYGSVFQIRVRETAVAAASGGRQEGVIEAPALKAAIKKVAGVDLEPRIIGEDQVGGQITGDLKRTALWAIFVASVLIVLYITVRFEIWYALAALTALFHDVLISAGLFGLAWLCNLKIELNLPEVAALLTIFGYSINDTIVVFDRIRENVQPGRGDFVDLVNRSINETLPRTLITSATTIITVLALLILGGATLFSFALILLFGMIAGTYSSVFIASPVLVWLKHWRHAQAAESNGR